MKQEIEKMQREMPEFSYHDTTETEGESDQIGET